MADRNFEQGPASQTVMSMSQALLAPLDAILKAQVHAARSFLNFIIQIGYPHQPTTKPPGDAGGGGPGTKPDDGVPYRMDFDHEVDGRRQRISIPTLALVPVSPLGVTDAQFRFDFFVRQIARHAQIQAAEADKTRAEADASKDGKDTRVDRYTRPWFLVDTPLSLQGTFAPSAPAPGENVTYERADEARFHVEVKVAAMPMPAALEKLLSGLAQVTTVADLPPQQAPPSAASAPASPPGRPDPK